jgi:hypothetical protein
MILTPKQINSLPSSYCVIRPRNWYVSTWSLNSNNIRGREALLLKTRSLTASLVTIMRTKVNNIDQSQSLNNVVH